MIEVIASSRVELKEGSSNPTYTRVFDEDKQYGAYGVLGFRRRTSLYVDELLAGASVVTCMPYNKENVQYIRGLLNCQMELAIPETHRKWVEWIYKEPGNNPLNEPIGTVGWVYRKKDE